MSAMFSPCPACGRTAPLRFRARDFNQRVTDEVFIYYRCGDCGLIFLSPTPADLGRYYPSQYYPIPERLDESTPGIAVERDKLRLVRDLIPPSGRLLEVGPSWGTFAYVAKQAGYVVEAIEMDERCSEFLNTKVGVPTTQSADPAATLRALPAGAIYDIVAFWQVIEHLPEPWTFFAAAAERLLPGGILILATPNPRALQFRIFGSCWVHLDAPRHLQLIPAELLLRRGRELGLEPALLTASDAAAAVHTAYGWERSLTHVWRRSNPARVRGAYRLSRLLMRILAPMENTDLRGVSYTLALRRPLSGRVACASDARAV